MPVVAFVISTLDAGGAESQLVNTVNALPSDFEPWIFVLRDSLTLRAQVHHPRARVAVVGLRSRLDLVRWFELGRDLRAISPEVIHSHMLLSNLAVRLLAPFSGARRVINHEHGLAGWKGPVLNLVDRLSQGLADHVVVVSEASRAVRLSRARLDPARVVVLPNAVDCEQWSVVGAAPADRPHATWGIAARFHPAKRIEMAIEILSRAHALGAAPRLLVAGDGPEREKLVNAAVRLGIRDSVEFLGKLDHMEQFYAGIDVLLLTSSTEDCPMTVLEGMACGKFIAATPVGGVPELLRGVADSCAIGDDLDQVARTLVAIPAGFDSLTTRALARRFDVRTYVQELLTLYGFPSARDGKTGPAHPFTA